MQTPDCGLGKVMPGTAFELPAVFIAEDYRADDTRYDHFTPAVLSLGQCLAIARLVRDNPEVFETNVRKELRGMERSVPAKAQKKRRAA